MSFCNRLLFSTLPGFKKKKKKKVCYKQGQTDDDIYLFYFHNGFHKVNPKSVNCLAHNDRWIVVSSFFHINGHGQRCFVVYGLWILWKYWKALLLL